MAVFKFYQVGGCVRDEILGVKSKDIDYSVVYSGNSKDPAKIFKILSKYLHDNGYEIFLETPESFTIRAKKDKEVADFVLARKELGYLPGTRQPIVALGSLFDDLERRDFTINAIAKDDRGNYIDYFGGLNDLKNGLLRTPLPAKDTFKDDPLRVIRAVRFHIKYGFKMAKDVRRAIGDNEVLSGMGVVSNERIREELHKMMQHDSLTTVKTLVRLPESLQQLIFYNGLWLKPTTEKR